MPTKHSGCLVKSSFGHKGNFEVVVPSNRGGFVHLWRDNDSDALPWSGPQLFGCSSVSTPALLQNDHGPLEVVACVKSRLVFYSRSARWKSPKYFASGVTGNPAVIQTEDGKLHMVVPSATGGFKAFSRASDPDAPWQTLAEFGSDAGQAQSVALLQSNFGNPGNLEILAVMGSGASAVLAHYWRNNEGNWFGPGIIDLMGAPPGAAPAGMPAFLQSRHGTKGHFELVVPLTTGGLAHLRRDNDSADLGWIPSSTFATGLFSSVSMLQSNFGSPDLGNFELIGSVDGRVEHYWCDDGSLQWNGPTAILQAEPATNAANLGEWRIEHICEPVGIHAALLNTNKVLFFAYHEENHTEGVSSVFNPENESVEHVDQEEDLFCSGHAFLPDGRLMVAGGHVTGEKSMFIFSPSGASGSWEQLPDMPVGRWYPNCATLPDGSVFVLSGAKQSGGGPINDTYQIFHPSSGLQAAEPAPFFHEVEPCNTYPFVFVLPSGKLFIFAFSRACLFDLATMSFGPERFLCQRQEPRTYPLEGTCVLLPLLPESSPPYRARVMVIGGGGLPLATTTPATDTCELLDLDEAAPTWKNAPPMSSPRVMPDATLLPDGTVLVMNGSSTGKADDAINPVFQTEIYHPKTNSWQAAGEMRVPRLYHATALLLPEGTVMTAGLDESFNQPPYKYPEYRLEVFRPPYMFKGPRPQIQSAPATVSYGTQFGVQCDGGATIQSAALLRCGSVTHSFNMDQRYVGLKIVQQTGATVTLQAPPNGKVAPPGYYLLFVLNDQGVPSVGKFVKVQ